MDRNWGSSTEGESVWKKKSILSLDLPGWQLLCASCLEYTTCSLKPNGEIFPSWASTFCHMLLPEPYIRPELPCLSPCCWNFPPQNPEEKQTSVCLVLTPPKLAVVVDSFSFMWLSESPKPVPQWSLKNNDPQNFVFSFFLNLTAQEATQNPLLTTHFLVH